MTKVWQQHLQMEMMKKIGVVLLSGVIAAVALNFFLIPAQVLAAGMNGVAQIVVSLGRQYLGITFDTGIFIFLLNVPIFIVGFLKLGKAATFWSFMNVISVSLFTIIIPQGEVTNNILMNAIVGGVLLGVGGGLSLKLGFTTGGLDIVSLILSNTTGKTVGNFMLLLNGIIVLIAGFIFNWESALYTIISIYAMSHVVDAIHTSHQKVTAFIITTKPDKVGQNISEHIFRGMTLLPSMGGYSGVEGKMIMMVVTRYELYDLEQAILEVDENAFVDFVPTQSIIGRFASEDDQRTFKATGVFPEIKMTKKKAHK